MFFAPSMCWAYIVLEFTHIVIFVPHNLYTRYLSFCKLRRHVSETLSNLHKTIHGVSRIQTFSSDSRMTNPA